MVYAEDDVDSPCVQHRMNRSDYIARQGNTRLITPQDQLGRKRTWKKYFIYRYRYVYIAWRYFPLSICPDKMINWITVCF